MIMTPNALLPVQRLLTSKTNVLFIVLLMFSVLWSLYPHAFSSSDPWSYSVRAYHIAQDHDFTGTSNIVDHRLGVLIPVALFYKLFDINIFTTNLWTLCATLLIISTVWIALPDNKSKLLGAILCLLSVPLFKASVELLPDIIAAAFMAMSSLALFSRRRFIQTRGVWLLNPLASVCFIFFAFLAKESAYWVLPLWALTLVKDMRTSDSALLFRRFYAPAFVAFLALGLSYLFLCHAIWGDMLARFKGVESWTGQHLWSWDRVSSGAFLRRLTISPIHLFLAQYGFIFLMAVLSLFIIPTSMKPWGYYSGLCVCFYWFGSTSFTRYEPMPLFDRMTLPALPGLYILAAFLGSRLELVSLRPRWINSAVPLVLILGIAGVQFETYVKSWRWRAGALAERDAIAIVKNAVTNHPANRYALVCSDTRSPESLAFYFKYNYPSNLHVVASSNLTQEVLANRKLFVFVNSYRSVSLKTAYGEINYDDQIESLGLSQAYNSNGVILYKAESFDELKGLLVPNIPKK